MRCRYSFILTLYHLLVCITIQAQSVIVSKLIIRPPVNYIFRDLDNTHGLIGNDIYSITQDDKGYIWIGNNKGLQRYDGIQFVNCTDTATDGSLHTTYLYADDAGHRVLYHAGTQQKQWNYYTNKASAVSMQKEWAKGKAENFTDQRGLKMQLQLPYKKNGPDKGNMVEGLALVTLPDQTVPDFAHYIQDKAHEEIWVMIPDHNLFVFDYKQKRVYNSLYDTVGNTLRPFVSGNIFPPPYDKTTIRIFRNWRADHHGNIWITTWSNYIFRYNLPSRQLYGYNLSEIVRKYDGNWVPYASASTFLDDNHGNLWIATSYGGLLQYCFKDSSFTRVMHWPGNNLSLQYNYDIYSLFLDKEENIWVGSDKGISIFNPNRQSFTRLNDSLSQLQSVPSTELAAAFQGKNGGLYVGYWGDGICMYDTAFHLKKRFFFNDDYAKNQIWSFIQNDDGNIWVGCQYGWLHIIDPVTLSIKSIRPPQFEYTTIRVMVRDNEGNILFGLHSGKVVVWRKKTNQFLPYRRELQPASLKPSHVCSMLIEPSGLCLTGVEGGLLEFDVGKGSFKDTLYHPPSSAYLLVQSMCPYRGDTVLAAMREGGLYFFDTKSKIFTPLRSYNTEIPQFVYAVRVDEEKNIWFVSDYEVYKYEPRLNKLSTFRLQNGLLSAPFREGRNFITTSLGKWVTWTATELITFDPKELSASRKDNPQITITGLKVFDRSMAIDSLLFVKTPIVLSYKENFITIGYSDMQFSGVEPARYHYRLSNVDKDWVNAGNRAYVSYTGLQPGKYRFEVRSGAPGTEGNIAFVDIVINGPFWGTIWFKTLVVVLLAAIIFVLVQWRIRTIRYKAHMQEQIATTKVMALRAQMNPHFIFNCINSIDALIQSDDKYRATIYLNKFAKLIRHILDSSMQSTVVLSSDLETLQLYIQLEQLRNENKFTAAINIDKDIDPDVYKVPPLIIQPYVENAILHGLINRPDNNGKLDIDVTVDDTRLTYVIQDNGIGREASRKMKQHKSYGMDVSSERVTLFNRQERATITITDLLNNGIACGTKVEVILNVI